MLRRIAHSNARISVVRAGLEHMFGQQKERMGLYVRIFGS